jgi:hypothetical protein
VVGKPNTSDQNSCFFVGKGTVFGMGAYPGTLLESTLPVTGLDEPRECISEGRGLGGLAKFTTVRPVELHGD